MSAPYDDYDDGPRRYHTVRTRRRDPDEPDYVREETYVERGKGAGPAPQRDLVFRGREDSIEDIDRDFPPPSGRSYRGRYDDPPRRSKSTRDRGYYDDDYDDDRYTDYAAGGAAAGAGYAAGRRSGDRRRRDRDRDYSPSRYSDDSRRPDKERRKSGVEELLGGLGLGAIAANVLGKKDDKGRDDRSVRSRSRSRPAYSRSGRSYRSEGERSRSRSRDGKDKTQKKWAQAAQAALIAGAIEAVRARNEPGAWNGEKGKRIATAAIGAGGIDRLIDRNPNEKTKRHLAEAVIGGLAANRLANGPRSKSRGRDRAGSPDSYMSGRSGRTGRSRSIIDRFRGRSASRGPTEAGGENKGGSGIKELVAGGALAAAGKAIYDRVRSKSRHRQNDRDRDRDSSADSYVPSRNRRRDVRRRRSPPMTGTAAAGGAITRQTRGIDRGPEGRDTNGNNDRALAVGAGGGAAALASRDGEEKKDDNLSDSSSTTSMENKRKKMRWKETITAGLAAVATIHAAHGVYSSMEAHEKRHRLVAEGEMTPEEARKKQSKAWVQDAAAVGIAALGIKGAFSEWKEMNEQRREIHELEKRKRERRKRVEAKKRREEAEHRQQMLDMMERNPQAAMYMMHQDSVRSGQPMPMMYMPSSGGGMSQPPGPVEQSGNPYAPRAGY